MADWRKGTDYKPGDSVGTFPQDGVAQHMPGKKGADAAHSFDYAVKTEDGWQIYYKNGDSFHATNKEPPKPDPNWTPDTSNSQMGDPWDIYKGSQPPFPDAPPVPGGTESPGKGVNVISVDAIKNYANNIRALKPVITQAIKELDDLAARGFGPGNFGAANNFKTKVFGGGSGGQSGATLLVSTRQVFVEAETIINEVAARCDEIAAKYKTVDELTELDAKEFTTMVSSVKSKVDNLPLGGAS